jgi:HAD superfamily hydrolase (TIGR01490 family)
MTPLFAWLFSTILFFQAGLAWEGFNAAVAASIERAVAENGKGRDVVFDADGTLWAGDVGESFFLWELENKKLLPEQLSRARQLWRAYQEKRVSERDMWIAATTLQAGLREADVRRWARDFFHQRFERRVFPAMRLAIATLQQRGDRVWIVSASHLWIIQAGAGYLHVSPSNVIAISAKVQHGRITDEVINPVPFQAGKVDAIRDRLPDPPIIAFSDSINDLPMLELATSVRVVINPDDRLRATALSRGWSIQEFK